MAIGYCYRSDSSDLKKIRVHYTAKCHTHTHTPSFLTPFPLTVNQTIQEEDIMNIVKMHQFYIFYFPRLERTEIKFYTFLQCAHLCPCIMIFQKLANWRIYIRMYLLLPQSTCFKFITLLIQTTTHLFPLPLI